MTKTFKARYRNGVIEPLEPLSMDEGKEIAVTVIELPSFANTGEDPILKTAGTWKGLVDCEELKRNIYADRLLQTRPEPKL